MTWCFWDGYDPCMVSLSKNLMKNPGGGHRWILYHFDHKFTRCYALPHELAQSVVHGLLWCVMEIFEFISTSSWHTLAQKSAWQLYLGCYNGLSFTIHVLIRTMPLYSVAMVITDVFWKKWINVSNKLVRIMKIFTKKNDLKNHGVI